jgi:hypothetical protein
MVDPQQYLLSFYMILLMLLSKNVTRQEGSKIESDGQRRSGTRKPTLHIPVPGEKKSLILDPLS